MFILGVSGAILAFEEELKDWLYADKLFVEAPTHQLALPLSQSLETARKALDSGYSVQSISIQTKSESTLLFRSLTRNADSKSLWYWKQITYAQNVYVDPYTATIVAQENPTLEFFRVVLKLHWSLLMIDDIGQPIIGGATLVFVILLVSGLVLWWPRNKGAAKQRVWFRWKDGTRWKRKNYDLHNILGFYGFLLLLVIALTGLVWAFDWFEDGVKWVANGGRSLKTTEAIHQSDSGKTRRTAILDEIHECLKTTHANAKSYFIRLPRDGKDAFYVFVNCPGSLQDLQLYFDQYSGERIATSDWAAKNNGEKIRSLNYDIHRGTIFGLPGKILAFCLSLIAASLPVTGFLVWRGRGSKRIRSKNP